MIKISTIEKKHTEAILPDGQIVPRSGTTEGNSSFPFENFGKEKYSGLVKKENDRYQREDIRLDFHITDAGVYQATLVCDHISKSSGQANDKLYVYDLETGAHFSMDISDLLNLVMGLSQGRHTVSKNEKGQYLIFGIFIMRGHFLSPYTQELEETIGAKELKTSDIVPSIDVLYKSRTNEFYMYLGTGEVEDCYISKDKDYRTQAITERAPYTVTEKGHIRLSIFQDEDTGEYSYSRFEGKSSKSKYISKQKITCEQRDKILQEFESLERKRKETMWSTEGVLQYKSYSRNVVCKQVGVFFNSKF